MKSEYKITLISLLILTLAGDAVFSQIHVKRTKRGSVLLVSDYFESGTSLWTLEGSWGLSTLQSTSPTHSLADSPTGNYGDAENTSATFVGVDLSLAADADLYFTTYYDVENGADFVYLEASSDGSSWTGLDVYTGNNGLMNFQSYSLAAFVGQPNVQLRFRLQSDALTNMDGIYVDDLEIYATIQDTSGPVIVHDAFDYYMASLDEQFLLADVSDASGIGETSLYYSVDNAPSMETPGNEVTGGTYAYTIPGQLAGSRVDYFISATDASPNANVSATPLVSYLSGNYYAFDNGTYDSVVAVSGGGVAVRVDLPTPWAAKPVTILIRGWYDGMHPGDSVWVHVWSNSAGFPGNDLMVPIRMKLAQHPEDPSEFTIVDLRPYGEQLGIHSSFHIGLTVDAGDTAWIVQKTAGTFHVSSVFNTGWSATNADFGFRAITDTLNDPTLGIADRGNPKSFMLYPNFPNPFNPSTTIRYDLAKSSWVKLTIHNTAGQAVRTLINGHQEAGENRVEWNGQNQKGRTVATGVYFFRLQVGADVQTRKIILLK